MEEMLDLVDQHDQIIKTVPRSQVEAEDLFNFRLVCVFVRDHEGHFYVPRRAAHKKQFPNKLACVGGCVQSGETYDQACAREVFEEITINIHEYSCRLLGYVNPWQHGVKGYTAVYELTVNPQYIQLNVDDFSEIIKLTPTQLTKQVVTDQATHNFPILLHHFYGIKVL